MWNGVGKGNFSFMGKFFLYEEIFPIWGMFPIWGIFKNVRVRTNASVQLFWTYDIFDYFRDSVANTVIGLGNRLKIYNSVLKGV